MKITHIGSVYQISFMAHAFPINCYIVEEKNELTLIDAGLSYCYKSILKTVEKIGKPITRIVITHLHWDHVGNIAKLISSNPNIKLYVPEDDYSVFCNNNKYKTIVFDKTVKPDYLVKNHDKVGNLEVITTPGHTLGSISLYYDEMKVMFVGDAFQTKGGLAVAGDTRLLFPFIGLATWNKVEAVKSAKIINKYIVKVIASGHGKMLVDSQNRLNVVINRAQNKLALAHPK